MEKKRCELGLSQSEFASLLGISLSTYKRLVNGGTKKLYDALKFALNYRVATGSSIMEIYNAPSPQHKLLYKLNKLNQRQLEAVESVIDAFLNE